MQPGTTASASQEFIELYNQSNAVIDLTAEDWQLQIASSTATDWTKAKIVHLSGLFYPGRYYLAASNYILSGDTKSYLQDYASAQFTSGLTAASGHIRLVTRASLQTTAPTEDSLDWSTKTTGGQLISLPIGGLSSFALVSDMPAGSSIKRLIDTNGLFVTTTGGSAADFLLSPCPSPTANNIPAVDVSLSTDLPLSTDIDLNQTCVPTNNDSSAGSIDPPTTVPPVILLPDSTVSLTSTIARIPSSDSNLEAPQITELLPNPAAPQTDADNEFIELYNGNITAFDLSGFTMTAGTSGSQVYAFPEGVVMPPQSFQAFYVTTTGLTLSNSGGKVALYDPLGDLIGQTEPYGTAKAGQAWALAQGVWHWTDMPSPGAMNVIHTIPPITQRKTASTVQAAGAGATTKAASKTSTKKTTATLAKISKPGTAKKAGAPPKAVVNQNSNVIAPSSTPIHPWILALIGGGALLYGAYEYRRDVASKFYQLRSNRAARRALGSGD